MTPGTRSRGRGRAPLEYWSWTGAILALVAAGGMAAIFAYESFMVAGSSGGFPRSLAQLETFEFLLYFTPGFGGLAFAIAWLVQQRRRFGRFESAAERQFYLALPPPAPPASPPSALGPPGPVWGGPVWAPTRMEGPSWGNVGCSMVIIGAVAWFLGWLSVALAVLAAYNTPTFNVDGWWGFAFLLIAGATILAGVGWVLHERAVARWLDGLAPSELEGG